MCGQREDPCNVLIRTDHHDSAVLADLTFTEDVATMPGSKDLVDVMQAERHLHRLENLGNIVQLNLGVVLLVDGLQIKDRILIHSAGRIKIAR